jgi:hypothetical protein
MGVRATELGQTSSSLYPVSKVDGGHSEEEGNTLPTYFCIFTLNLKLHDMKLIARLHLNLF